MEAGKKRMHAVVIGGGRGIGEAIVRRLAADGYIVTIVDHLEGAVTALAGELRKAGLEAHAEVADITKPQQLQALAETLRKRAGNGALMAAVNSVGVFDVRGTLTQTPLESFHRVMEINVTGAFLFSQAVIPLLRENASLVHIGSVNGVLAGAGLGAYKVSKAALHMMAKCLALELAREPRRIRVNVVAPGWVDTPGERLALQQEPGKPHPLDDPEALGYIPLGRRTQASEIANAVAFLCSSKAAAITGQTLFVDCGIAIR